jgi:hypothetical protein
VANKVVTDIFNLAERKGYTVAKSNSGITTIITDEGVAFEHSLAGGQSKVRRIGPPPAEMSVDHVDRTGRGNSGVLSFSNKDSGRRMKNILRELRGMGLDLDIRPKKETDEPEDDVMETTAETARPGEPEQETPTARAVNEILSSLSVVEDLLHSTVLESAQSGSCPVHESDGKVWMDWTGDVLEILKIMWPDIDVTDQAMGYLESKLIEGYLRRGGRFFRVHKNSDGTAVWRVRVPPGVNPTPERPEGEGVQADAISRKGEGSEGSEAEEKTMHKLYECDICPFVGLSSHAKTMHDTQMRGKEAEHRKMIGLRCPQCPAVRNLHLTLQTHLRKHHGIEHLCKFCADEGKVVWFTLHETYRQHSIAAHSFKPPRRKSKEASESAEAPPTSPQMAEVPEKSLSAPKATPRARAKERPSEKPLGKAPSAPEKPSKAAVEEMAPGNGLEPSTALSGRVVPSGPSDEAMEQAVIAMMRSVPELRAANATLQAQVEEERRLRRAAEEELARLSKAMKGITSALQGLQELEN